VAGVAVESAVVATVADPDEDVVVEAGAAADVDDVVVVAEVEASFVGCGSPSLSWPACEAAVATPGVVVAAVDDDDAAAAAAAISSGVLPSSFCSRIWVML